MTGWLVRVVKTTIYLVMVVNLHVLLLIYSSIWCTPKLDFWCAFFSYGKHFMAASHWRTTEWRHQTVPYHTAREPHRKRVEPDCCYNITSTRLPSPILPLHCESGCLHCWCWSILWTTGVHHTWRQYVLINCDMYMFHSLHVHNVVGSNHPIYINVLISLSC